MWAVAALSPASSESGASVLAASGYLVVDLQKLMRSMEILGYGATDSGSGDEG